MKFLFMGIIFYHKKTWCSIPFLLLISFAFGQNGIIKGQVKDGETILQNATVSVANKIVLSNSNGEFSIAVHPGSYALIVTHAGYKTLEERVTVTDYETRILRVNMIRDEQMGEVVVLGSRSFVERNNLNTPVPVDVFSSNKIMQTGQASLTQMLNFSAPSLNASREVFNEPVTLRGLDPDHVLILVNGIRYHTMAFLNQGNIKAQLGKGSVGNDLNSIPFSAIEKIEILRDGASAQYGSDAIAGVINVILKKTTRKMDIRLHAGQQYEGDGEKFSVGMNHGISFKKKGFLNYSGNFRYQAPTYRGGVYEGPVYYNIPANATILQTESILKLDSQKVHERNFDRKTPATNSNVGNSKYISYGFSMNGAYPVSSRTEIFMTAMINNRSTLFKGAYRFAKDRNQVDTALYPNGFTANINTSTLDVSGSAGVKGETKNKWHWQFCSAYGNNSVDNNVGNTNNASLSYLGKNEQTSFYVGKLIFDQLTTHISFTKNLTKSIAGMKSLNLGFGAEWRLENYQVRAGEETSWNNYDPSSKTLGGSQSFAGFHPRNAVNKKRNIGGAYVDIEAEVNNHFLFDLAARYEYYNDFGGNLAGKLAARYKFSEKFSLRGSVSNGFRAPSLQQLYLGSTATRFSSSGTVRTPVIQGTFPNGDSVTKAFGISALQPEKAINMSGGIVSKFSDHINLSIDAYWIEIKNRIVLSGLFNRSNRVVGGILAGYPDIDQVQFFTNAINTRSKGIDVVLNGHWTIQKTSLAFTLGANFSRTHLFGPIKTSDKLPADSLNTNTLFNIEERTKLEKGQPASKVILSMSYKKGRTELILRNTRFGKTATTTLYTNPSRTCYEFFSPKILTDISISYTLKSWLTLTAGVNNIFDVYPDKLTNYDNTVNGALVYSTEASPFGFSGGYYFLNMAFNW